jgi:predicted transcriptional regulator
MNENTSNTELMYQVKDIVAAYVSNNSLPAAELPRLISAAHAALSSLVHAHPSVPAVVEPLTPAVPIKKSVTNEHIVCLECGKGFVSIKRHLANGHNMTPDQYRERWGLPQSYPVVTPSYSERRSALAKESGLGRKAKI